MGLYQETIQITLDKLLKEEGKLRRGTDLVYHCPKCNHYKRKLEINIFNGKYHCWVCNFQGSTFKTLFSKLGADHLLTKEFAEVEKFKKPIVSFSKQEVKEEIHFLPPEFERIGNPKTDTQYLNAVKYLKNRNITTQDIIRYDIGFCRTGEYANRIVIPSYDSEGNLNFFTARDFTNKHPYKYKLCHFSKNIIGFESLINFKEPINLVEGQFDAIAIRRNAIPLFGKTLSTKLKNKILTLKSPHVNVILDNDARKDSIKICEFLLKNNISVSLVTLNEKDPSILGFEQVWNLINSTKPLNFYNLIEQKLKL